MLDIDAYRAEPEAMKRINLINRGISARLDKNLIDQNMIVRDVFGGMGSGVQWNITELSNDEIAWVNSSVSTILKFSTIEMQVDKGLETMTHIKSHDYSSRESAVKEFESWITETQNILRTQAVANTEERVFSLSGSEFEEAMLETYDAVTSPSNKLIFGTQALNQLFCGGVEGGRVYILLALPGEGKSSTLLDMCIQLKRYNANYKCKDPTKRPCVVLIVMENSFKETISRLYGMSVLRDMEEFSREEFMDEFRKHGLTISDNSPVDLKIFVVPNMSKDTSYLYTVCDDLSDQGYEVIAVAEDYLKTMRSVYGSFGGDYRMQIGSVVNEMKVFCTIKDIPMLSASQLNRVATTNMDNARIRNKSDLVRVLGRGNVGDSNLILENADGVFLLAPEIDRQTGTKYIGMLRCKGRFKQNDISCAYMPYVKDTLKLVEDINAKKPAHKLSMSGDDDNMPNGMSSGIIGAPNAVQSFSYIAGNMVGNTDANNIFEGGTMAASNTIFIPQKQLVVYGKPLCRIAK